MGSCLGEMTNELECFGSEAYIEQFVGAGPKNYGFKVRKPDGSSESVVKIRGFTLNYQAAARLNLKTLREKVKKFVRGVRDPHPINIIQPQITRSHNREVVTQDRSKRYSIVYDKRWVLPTFSTVPFGTCVNFGVKN